MAQQRAGFLDIDELRALVAVGEIDTVIVALTDMQGRLVGKRCSAEFFLAEASSAQEGCDYLLAVDVENNTVSGYALSSWDSGYGDIVMRPDLASMRHVPWQPKTALVLCDIESTGGQPVAVSPRQVLKRQMERLRERGLEAFVGTELEFILFDDTYEEAWDKRYSGLQASTRYNVDYSILGTSRVAPLLRAITDGMTGAGLYVESAKGECNPGQQEIAFRFSDALTTCDSHSIYKNGAKEIAALHGSSLTFMAKYNEREGNSCHVHLSLRSTDGKAVLPGEGEFGFSPVMEQLIAGQLAALRDFTYFLAPNINSYKRFAEGSFAPTAVAWGQDNRSCALRVVGHGQGMRVENRVGGGDVNPYLIVAALIAAAIYGIDHELPLPPITTGNAYASDAPRVATNLREAAEALRSSEIAVEAFGQEVVDHYCNAARVELAAFESFVTDWEKVRGFERL